MSRKSLKRDRPSRKVVIVGGSIAGAFSAWHAFQQAKSDGEAIRITVLEKNTVLAAPICNIVPSKTPDELAAVVPPPGEIDDAFAKKFDEPGGIRMDDVPGINDSAFTARFMSFVKAQAGRDDDIRAHLLNIGRISMELWDEFSIQADPDLDAILKRSYNYPCGDSYGNPTELRQGYRIDPVVGTDNAEAEAEKMKAAYETLGYQFCRLLSPDEVLKLDPSLIDFVKSHSEENEGKRQWLKTVHALFRPGGAFFARIFLPLFYEYLSQEMGTYINEQGVEKKCFRLKENREVVSTQVEDHKIISIEVTKDGDKKSKRNDHYKQTTYIICTGYQIKTLEDFGFMMPPSAKFAGNVIMLKLPLLPGLTPPDNFMELHNKNEKTVLACQIRPTPDQEHLFVGIGGKIAYAADQDVTNDHEFGRSRSTLQLNYFNKLYPTYLTAALRQCPAYNDIETDGMELTFEHVQALEAQNFLTRWVGSRGCTGDVMPLVGQLHTSIDQEPVENAYTVSGASSGGGSSAIGLTALNQYVMGRCGLFGGHRPNAHFDKLADAFAPSPHRCN